MHRFQFRHRGTGQVLESMRVMSLNRALEQLGIAETPDGWTRWSCGDAWHCTESGETIAGPRPAPQEGPSR